MSSNAAWSPYTGSSAIILAVVLLIITGALVYSGMRLRHPLVAARPGRFLGACIVMAWLLAVLSFLYAVTAYIVALTAQSPNALNGSSNPITPITALSGLVAFVIILYLTLPSVTRAISLRQFWAGVGSAVVGVIAAPMIFELPYDLIVLWRTHPASPATLYTPLFFLPLFLVEILSFAMLTFSPFMNVSRTTLFLLATMFLTFAVWAMFGFGFPSTPVTFALNSIGKVIAFAAAVSLFLPMEKKTGVAA